MKILFKFLIIISTFNFIGCAEDFPERHKYAESIILKVEEFKNKENRLPNNVSEIGLKETDDSPAYYQKINEKSFEVSYAIGVESKIYNSITKQWREEG